MPVTPGRALDTRSGPKPTAGSTRRVTPAAALGLTGGVGSVVASLTATESSASGFLTAWPSGQGRPFTSSLNIEGPGQTVANAAIVGLAGGAFDIFTLQGAHLLADVSGYFQTSTPVGGDLVRWAYWGHLYADGQYDAGAGTWTWNQSPYQLAESAARFQVAAAANGVQVQAKANGAYVTTTKPHPAAPDMRGRPNAEVQWFLAALDRGRGRSLRARRRRSRPCPRRLRGPAAHPARRLVHHHLGWRRLLVARRRTQPRTPRSRAGRTPPPPARRASAPCRASSSARTRSARSETVPPPTVGGPGAVSAVA